VTAADLTQRAIDRVIARLDAGGIRHVVVATTSGETALRFAEALAERDVRMVCITHASISWGSRSSPPRMRSVASIARSRGHSAARPPSRSSPTRSASSGKG
jgi:hypothetical protein